MNNLHLPTFSIGPDTPLTIIAGPCLAESESLCMDVGAALRDACRKLGFNYIFKASFDKANRSSITSIRGPGAHTGLALLAKVRAALGVPATTDIHESHQAAPAAQAVDLLQIPAFLCRQTDLLLAAAATGKPVNVKKGQFISPQEMKHAITKLTEGGADKAGIMLTERGTFFGYHRLVNDFAGLGDLMELNWPVCFDVTHSTQRPGEGTTTGGRPERAPLLARAAVAAGVQALFLEVHTNPKQAQSDAATQLTIPQALELLPILKRIRDACATTPRAS